MAQLSRQISFVVRDNRRRITHVGGFGADGSKWTLPVDEAKRRIETKTGWFYVAVGPEHEMITIDDSGGDIRFFNPLRKSIHIPDGSA